MGKSYIDRNGKKYVRNAYCLHWEKFEKALVAHSDTRVFQCFIRHIVTGCLKYKTATVYVAVACSIHVIDADISLVANYN